METKLRFSTEGNTAYIYEGAAPVIHEPKVITIAGTIDAPARWLKNKAINPANAHVLVNREKVSITLKLEDKDHFGDTITGTAQLHPVFVKFGINSGDYRTPPELAQFFKMNRSHFENQSAAMKLVTELQNFKAKINGIVEKSDNNRGNTRMLVEQAINSNVPEKFNLLIPIFKGQEKQTIEVEIYIKADDMTCALVSPQANDKTEEYRDFMIDKVLAEIEELVPGIATIEI